MQPRALPAQFGADRYSWWRLLREGLSGQRGWRPAWRKATPRARYRVVIVGGGGHGLATAYYLAAQYGITDVAVLERGPIGLGNVGRNTTIIRSNYFLPDNIRFYEFSLKLWEGLEQELNFNAMVSQRGTLNLFHTEAQRDPVHAARQPDAPARRRCRARSTRAEVQQLVPLIDLDNGRYPVLGGFLQRRGGTVRHDAVAWGYARAASTRRRRHRRALRGDRTSAARAGASPASRPTRGSIGADRSCLAVAGHSSRLAAMAGLKLPIESHVLQAFVSEGVKPLIDVVLTYGAGHFYISQSDKGGLVFGGAIDGYNTYGQRGTLPMAEEVSAAAMTLTARAGASEGAAAMGRRDGHDHGRLTRSFPRPRSKGLILNGGWCYGGFKAIPAGGMTTAHLIAQRQPASGGRAPATRPFRERAYHRRARRRARSLPALTAQAMLRIPCPWCGVRDEVEFRYRGDATRARPAAQQGLAAFHAYIYERDNPQRLAPGVVAARRRLPQAAQGHAPHRDARDPLGRWGRREPACAGGAVVHGPARIGEGLLTRPPRRVGFSFDGRALEGLAGDTLASALLANGVASRRAQLQVSPPARHLHLRPRRAVRAGRCARGAGREPTGWQRRSRCTRGSTRRARTAGLRSRFDALAINDVAGAFPACGVLLQDLHGAGVGPGSGCTSP